MTELPWQLLLCDEITERRRFWCYISIIGENYMKAIKNIAEILADYLYYRFVGCDGSL